LQAGYAFAPHHGPLSLRIELGLFIRNRSLADGSSHAQVGSANLSLTYRLGHGRTQPYLIGGAGVNRLYLGQSHGGYVLPELGGTGTVSSLRQTSGSVLAGVGLQRRVLGLWLFSEARYTVFTHGTGIATHILPVTFGVRF
jgi:hypothetical protein